MLEGEVLASFADRPRWARMMRSSIEMAKKFSALRMVEEYFRDVYLPERAAEQATG